MSKVRGVNLGSLFIIEPWMLGSTWQSMGCGGKASEFDCMLALGQEKGDQAFQNHWAAFVQESDFDEMLSYGINTVRIPIGYWMYEDLVYKDSEHFPRVCWFRPMVTRLYADMIQGGFEYLKKVVGWATSRHIYVVLV